MPTRLSRNVRFVERARRPVVTGAAVSTRDPYEAQRRSQMLREAETEFLKGYRGEYDPITGAPTGEAYEKYQKTIQDLQSRALGGSSQALRFGESEDVAQKQAFSISESGEQQQYAEAPSEQAFGELKGLLEKHQQVVGGETSEGLRYAARITDAERAEQDRNDTLASSQFTAGSFVYAPKQNITDEDLGVSYRAGESLEGFDAYQAYLLEQRDKYDFGTVENAKYNNIARNNWYNKQFADLMAQVGTTREGEIVGQLETLRDSGAFQPGTPQYEELQNSIKGVYQNMLDQGWETFWNETVLPDIQKVQSQIQLDMLALQDSYGRGLKVNVGGREYDFSTGTDQQRADLFNSLYGAMVAQYNDAASPANLPSKPFLEWDDTERKYEFTIPGYTPMEYSSKVEYTTPAPIIPEEKLPESNVPKPEEKEPKKKTERDMAAEQKALGPFGRLYGRMPNFADEKDSNTHYIMAYGYDGPRDMKKEQDALKIFGAEFGRMPSSDEDWRIHGAIAYGDLRPVGY